MTDAEFTVKEIFKDLFDIEDVDASMTREDIEEWDSLMHIQLILALETSFNTKFTTTQIVEMNSIKKIVEIINQKMA